MTFGNTSSKLNNIGGLDRLQKFPIYFMKKKKQKTDFMSIFVKDISSISPLISFGSAMRSFSFKFIVPSCCPIIFF